MATVQLTAADRRMLGIGLTPDVPYDLPARVAHHIGSTGIDLDGSMRCPACGGWDFGPTCSLTELTYYTDGYLPGTPLCIGVCMDCEHITHPALHEGPAPDARILDTLRAAGRRRASDLANAPLLVGCPRCRAYPGGQCVTDTGFVGGCSGPHAARKKIVADWTEQRILAGWAERRAVHSE